MVIQITFQEACEEIDAHVFSGDILYNGSDRATLREYAERWLRAIDEHERMLTISEEISNATD